MNLSAFSNFSFEYVVVAMAGIILYLLYYVFTKDADYNKNIRSVASVVEELQREIFYLKKNGTYTQAKNYFITVNIRTHNHICLL